MPQIGDVISDKYRILERLGAGGMGVVFLAVHLDTEKRVALKWLNPAIAQVPTGKERFKREAKATGRIHHPNVVSVHDWSEHLGELYIVMEYLSGCTLRAHLMQAHNHRLAVESALSLMFPIMRGVAAAHAVRVLHRDLKPDNVWLAESPDGLPPVPKVFDFGLAKLRNATGLSAKLSVPGSVLGTFQYMAPEQLTAHAELDERSDVYSLGAMLYEMLAGAPPYRADNAVDLMLQLRAGDPPPLHTIDAEVPAGLSEVVGLALARDPGERYASVEVFAAGLESWSGAKRFRTGGGSRPTVPPDFVPPAPPSVLTRPPPRLTFDSQTLAQRGGSALLSQRHDRRPLQAQLRDKLLRGGGGWVLGLLALLMVFLQPTVVPPEPIRVERDRALDAGRPRLTSHAASAGPHQTFRGVASDWVAEVPPAESPSSATSPELDAAQSMETALSTESGSERSREAMNSSASDPFPDEFEGLPRAADSGYGWPLPHSMAGASSPQARARGTAVPRTTVPRTALTRAAVSRTTGRLQRARPPVHPQRSSAAKVERPLTPVPSPAATLAPKVEAVRATVQPMTVDQF